MLDKLFSKLQAPFYITIARFLLGVLKPAVYATPWQVDNVIHDFLDAQLHNPAVVNLIESLVKPPIAWPSDDWANDDNRQV